MTKVKNEQARFLETISFGINDLLIPINRIKSISAMHTQEGGEIKISSDDGIEAIECFHKDQDKMQKRYDQIKEIISAK
jgi:hypothetical protein